VRLSLATLLALVCWLPLHAHGLRLHASIESETIEILVGYGIGQPASGITLVAYGPGDAVLHRGTSNGRGRWSLPKPVKGPLRMVADDGAGHRVVLHISHDELTAALTEDTLSSGASGPTPLRMGAGIGILLVIAGLAWWWSKRQGRA
jgi:hypothetical protein